MKLYNQEVLKKPLTDTDLLVSINESNKIDTKNIDKKERRKLATEQQMAKLNSQ